MEQSTTEHNHSMSVRTEERLYKLTIFGKLGYVIT